MKSFFSAGLSGKPLLLLVLLCCGWPQLIKAQVSWSVTATADPSTCASNGQIHAHILNFDTVPLDSIRFLLYENVTLSRSSNPDSNFNALRPGTYKVVVNAYRGSTAVTSFVDGIVVTGNYQFPEVSFRKLHGTLDICNTGVAEITAYRGNGPFTVQMTQHPSTYTGITNFQCAASLPLQIDNLAAGSYSFKLTDQCGSSPAQFSIIINQLPPFQDWVNNSTVGVSNSPSSDCNGLTVNHVYVSGSDPDYNYYFQQFEYKVKYNGLIQATTYQNVIGGAITFLLNSPYKLANGETFQVLLKPPCNGNLITITKTIYVYNDRPDSYVDNVNCSGFNLKYYAYGRCIISYPVYVVINKDGNLFKKDTLTEISNNRNLRIPNPNGNYTVQFTASDGQTWTNNHIVTNPSYTILGDRYYDWYSKWGFDGSAQINLKRSDGGIFNSSTKVTLNGVPLSIHYFFNHNYINTPPLTPGTYTIHYEDDCKKDTLTITISNSQVYKYYWNIDSLHIKKVCGGFTIRPTGFYTFNNLPANSNTYFRIVDSPGRAATIPYEDYAQLSAGQERMLTRSGTYTIAIAATNFVGAYTRAERGGNDRNVITFTWNNEGAALDPVNSLGYVCPGLNDSLGSIYAVGWKGIPPYKYQLYNGTALLATKQGAGQTTSTSQLGVFFNSSTFPLIKNHTYTIKVTDSCGSSGQSDVKIIDLATAKLISSAYPTYCIGQDISMKIQNLPKTTSDLTTYLWTGPLGFSNTLQNPVIKNCTVANGGTYKVTVSTDLCNQPIHDSIDIPVKDWVPACYSTITDTMLNPFATGLTGNYRASRAFTYYASRAESDLATPINLRTNGTFASFSPYWKFVNGKLLNSQADTTKWVWNSTQTMYNVKGLELENKDALGRYNCGLYGYSATLPIAVVQNSQFKEAGFDGFEDYSYETVGCDGLCNSDRHWDFTVSPAFKLDTVESHTGKFSLKLRQHEILTVATTLSTDNFSPPQFAIVQKNNCTGGTGLRGIYADQKALIPNLSLLKGKDYWFSAWVKESGICKCESYIANKIVVHINYDGGSHADTEYHATGRIIEGWQRYEIPISLADSATSFSVSLVPTGTANVYFDDIRIHPFNANMKSFVYNPENLRLMSELDENNYATFYEYDNDGTLVRVKKETAKGVMTIKETRTSLQKGE